MAVTGIGSNNYNKTDRYYNDLMNGTASTSDKVFDAVFSNEDPSAMDMSDFFSLMIAQLTNQDFSNPVDDTQYVAQLAQFSTLSAMQEMAKYSEQNYVLSMLGKTCTASTYEIGGDVIETTGKVSSISLVNDEYKLTINGKQFSMSEIHSISDSADTENTDSDNKQEEK